MATLSICRAPEMAHRFSKVTYLINGEKVGEIKAMETQRLELPAGTYQVDATIGYVGATSFMINLQDGESKTIQISCSRKSSLLQTALYLTAFVLLSVSLALFGTVPLPILLLILFIWVIRDVVLTKGKSILYYLTTGRRKYLEIRLV